MAQATGGWSYQNEQERYGADDMLYAGQVYFPAHSRAEGHPFYRTSDWQPGRLYVRDQASDTVDLKYNLATQQVIVWHNPRRGPPVQLALPVHRVDSFQVAGAWFIHHLHAGDDLPAKGYVQPVYHGGFQVYQAVRKVYNAATSSLEYTGNYESTKVRFWLHRPEGEDEWVSFSSFNRLLASLTKNNRELKKTLKQAYRQEQIPRRTSNLDQLQRLLTI
jgi:hypothetical protein